MAKNKEYSEKKVEFKGRGVIENTDFDQDRILIPSTEEGKSYHAFTNDDEGFSSVMDILFLRRLNAAAVQISQPCAMPGA